MIKFFYILGLIVLGCIPCSSQSQASKYFMPETLSAFHMYHLFAPDGRITGIKRRIEYALINNEFVVNEVNGTHQNVMSATLQHIVFSVNQVLVTYSKRTNSLGANQVKRFDPPAILLKLPKGNETVSWVNKETGEKYTSRFVILNEDGEDKKFLATYRQNGNVIEAKYYYPGVGLWKTEMIKDGVSTTLYKLMY